MVFRKKVRVWGTDNDIPNAHFQLEQLISNAPTDIFKPLHIICTSTSMLSCIFESPKYCFRMSLKSYSNQCTLKVGGPE